MKLLEKITGKTIGYRTFAGTDFPVFYQIQRWSKRQYNVTLICNGVGEEFKKFASLKQALKYSN